MPSPYQTDVPLAGFTTLGLGGPARRFTRADSVQMLRDTLSAPWAQGPVLILAGGSNLVISDAGFDGLAIQLGMRGIETPAPGRMVVQAGEPWERVVEFAVERGWAGLECLTGIPGSAGATPIQNVGAYGQEVAQVVDAVEALDRQTGEINRFDVDACGFAYRQSRFKREPERWIVTSVAFRLRPGAAATVAYAELERALEGQERSLSTVRDAVLALRRRKSMVVDPNDPDSRSAGSFFTNPILDTRAADRVCELAVRGGMVERADEVPRYDTVPGRTKLPAAWLIERSGIAKGTRRGRVGVSSKHTLALVNLGGGTTEELLALAREIAARVYDTFGVELAPEPRFVGVAL